MYRRNRDTKNESLDLEVTVRTMNAEMGVEPIVGMASKKTRAHLGLVTLTSLQDRESREVGEKVRRKRSDH